MELVDVTVYYLEMLTHSQRAASTQGNRVAVRRSITPSVPYYRWLYDSVGRDYHWLSRRKLSDVELGAVLNDLLNELHVLHVEGSPAGFAELDCRNSDDIELVQFGLIPEFIGKGFGKWFLQWTIDKVWSYQPKRFWLHTCSLDHPTALSRYKKAGFVQYKVENIRREF